MSRLSIIRAFLALILRISCSISNMPETCPACTCPETIIGYHHLRGGHDLRVREAYRISTGPGGLGCFIWKSAHSAVGGLFSIPSSEHA